ncbi:hypothetical protein Golob_021978 [Gossypium lobatum]|uniref:Late embryogenesis abundant protein LEA-2 subgroup domain-containing protein n=2 Tax=Gossypium TaxID=3633 RepID=A0A7J8LF64_9ROSI|nr:hypothetical protein [Gossypium lobatum]
MHAKTDSEGTSIDASWPPRSPRRPVYYVQSPSNHDVEKMSYGSSPTASPTHHYYHCSPIHHSRESSTSRFSASLKNPRSLSAWKHVQLGRGDDDDDDDDDEMDGRDGSKANKIRLYLCLVFLFFVLFTVFSLILWGASRSYKPKILVKHIVFENFHYQAGNDQSGLPTDMFSLNSTVKISYRNPATFFAVHVTSTPWELHYFQLKIASGQGAILGQKDFFGLAVGNLEKWETPAVGFECYYMSLFECLKKAAKTEPNIISMGPHIETKMLFVCSSLVVNMALLLRMKKFTQSRKSQRKVVTIVKGSQVPLYGGVPVLVASREHLNTIAVPLNLTFVMRSRAYILGRLVKTKFYGRIRCSVTLRGNKLGKALNLTDSCIYQ